MEDGDFGEYYDFVEGKFTTAAYDTASSVSGTSSNSSLGNLWPGYPSV